MKRIVTYDVKKGNDYQRFYDFVDECKGVQITESTYELDTKLNQVDFEKRLRYAFSKDDNVAYISCNNKEGLFFLKLDLK